MAVSEVQWWQPGEGDEAATSPDRRGTGLSRTAARKSPLDSTMQGNGAKYWQVGHEWRTFTMS